MEEEPGTSLAIPVQCNLAKDDCLEGIAQAKSFGYECQLRRVLQLTQPCSSHNLSAGRRYGHGQADIWNALK